MASYTYEATAPDGHSKQFHLDKEPTTSELVNALDHTFPDADFAKSEVTGRDGRFRVQQREGGTFTVERIKRQESQ